MADRAKRQAGAEPDHRAAGDGKSWEEKHFTIVQREIEAINSRRSERPIPPAALKPGRMIDVAGLALSGGGIRSSAVGLGVLQALNHHDVIERIDYLSTVSGGGYIGSSLSATMTQTGRFVFGNRPTAGSAASAAEISDTPAVGHLRNYSNYLIPAGARDLLTGLAIVVRGLVANLSLTLPVVLLLVAVTIMSNPARSCLYVANLFGIDVGERNPFWFLSGWLPFLPARLIEKFAFTLTGMLAALLAFICFESCYGVFVRHRSKGYHIFAAYLAGLAVTIGAICDLARLVQVRHFGLTLSSVLMGLGLFLAWALWRSRRRPDKLQEFRGQLPTMGATYLVLVAVIAFFEFQPFMIAEMFDVAEGVMDQEAGIVAGVVSGWIKWLTAVTAPVAAAVALFGQQFADLIKGAGASELTPRILAYAAKAAVWVAGLALPLLIWTAYLYLSYWGVANDKVAAIAAANRQCVPAQSDGPASPAVPAGVSGKIQFNSEAKTLSAEIAGKEAANTAGKKPASVASHIPSWLPSASVRIPGDPDFGRPNTVPFAKVSFRNEAFGNNVNVPMAILYFAAALILFAISWILTPNANSLHRLYRDRLSKAFLFNPDPPERGTGIAGEPPRNEASLDQGRDFPDLDDLKLSALCATDPASGKPELKAPYQLINAALNIQGSDFANRRGRNADFFLFSALHVGSEATRYAMTKEFEAVAPGLDVATAMAISGAAASSNMGSNSVKSLTPTLALLNVRLGYWLKNPRYVKADGKPPHRSTPLYLWSEITGRLYENAEAVYLTDGGHIENLGVYELLRRRCKLIIAVDAEADAPMNFSSLMTLQRYARIDLGILIDLPWGPIRARTLELMNGNAGKPAASAPCKDRAHVAIGVIDYGECQKGYLVYIKSSLTGDENDYIRDYARRNSSFPHETTSDQFFSEEQFEVYRALGFHMAHGFLSGEHEITAAVDRQPGVTTTFNDMAVQSIKDVREALFGALPPAAPAN
ncbi:patatin-like phospholipase family protein [uncultured Bradyrhizobium sp.]|uniref:patatin-like phospholipase family protein n=1 Tax=uncultured Bradyrhizobium sp. TaxID=199684 RepID=UPI0035CBED81